MAEAGIRVLDGSLLRASLAAQLHDPTVSGNGTAVVSGADLLTRAESAVSSVMYGIPLPENLKAAAIRRISADDAGFGSAEFNGERAASALQNYAIAVADELKDDPLVVSILDGSALRLFLDDEDDFAMLAENLFLDLDIEDKGKIGKAEIKNALIHMGVDLGVPPFSESGSLLNDILKKHGAEGEEELGQAQFAELLQHVLQDLADALAEKQVVVIQNIKVNNGSSLRKVLADGELLENIVEQMIQDPSLNGDGGCIGNIRGYLEKNGLKLGLPSIEEANEAAVFLYDQVFADIDNAHSGGNLGKDEFRMVMKDILKKFAEQLEANPIFNVLEN